ncbi:BlaI/MecI/CopY family transcriptional regulator [Streptomyces diastatochromogenes]|uniref:Regulatory protein n=1 Tax=Streptomyces diastatochromogenes TaxID=42236 RepID=A0A233SY13_STRDA|nr:BlaI/MecI/CopY family transcriptional regulator [Streptomyces diastatochromogenes]MCZ0991776.1 BlaI/MecI/CopY family transcriptional regulator [Streptomyces diastatochromogenes]OXZ00515.1 hypothetical protein BEK98_00115 [Streptomyces diastatochromogenes]
MSEETATATELASQYISQVANDLEANVKEQERITAELTALQQQLVTLQRNHSVLMGMQQALGVTTPPAEPAKADRTAVPSPRKKTTAAPSKRRPAKTATAKPPATKKQSVRKPVTKKAATKTGTTLVDLIHGHVIEQSEPRSAAEIAEALGHAHPDRNIKTTVVRTTLENLVAKSLAQRTKQGSSVFYTAAHAPEPTAAPAAEVQPETAG